MRVFITLLTLAMAMGCMAKDVSRGALSSEADTVGGRSQAVGLVLSGGGAKGIAHIGVIQALEENDIPIDYVVGTSMGAIVGGLYASGYTPAEMLALIKSKGFSYWSTGKIDPELTYYFAADEPTPSLVTFNLGADSTKVKSILPTSLINPLPMSFAFMDLFSAYTAQCGGNFDNLFVPLRTVTSDIYAKHKIVLRGGSLADAIRASMSFPLVFRPIEIDSVLVYDGGIYDNYPFNVMHTDFAPDVMIGSNVSGPDLKPKSNDVIQQLEDMIIQNNDYSMPEEWGFSMNVPVRMFGILDFDKADILYEIGYRTAMEKMDSIKARVTARTPARTRRLRREVFKSQTPAVVFDSVEVAGGTHSQNDYIEYLFTHHRSDTFGMARARDAFYRAITPGKIENLVPHAVVDDSTGLFTLKMKATLKDNFKLGFGGYVSSSTSSMLFLSAGYNTMSFNSLTTSLKGWIGQSYMAGVLDARITFPTAIPSALRVQAVATRQKFYEDDVLFFKDNLPTFIINSEYFGRLFYGFAAGRRGKVEIGVGGGLLDDHFFPSSHTDFSTTRRDKTRRVMGEVLAVYDRSTLDNLNYPTSGSALHVAAIGATGTLKYLPNEGSPAEAWKRHLTFGQLEVNASHYLQLGSHAALGMMVNALASTRKLQPTYAASIVLAPSFNPTPSSYNMFNPGFRANSFVTAGLAPIWKITSAASLRGAFHCFMPMRKILENPDGTARYGRWFSNPEFIGEVAVALTFPFATLSAYGNYATYPARNWNFGISLGLFILAPRFLR